MTTLFSDAFTRADGSVLGAGNWTEVYDNFGIVSNQASVDGTGFVLAATTTGAHAAVADCKATMKRVSGASWDGGPHVRYSGAAGAENCYAMDVYGANIYEVYRYVAGASTLVGGTTGTHANGDTYGLEVSGTGATVTLKMYRNGAQIGSTITDSSGSRITAAGQTGFFAFLPGAQQYLVDDFLVEDIAAGGGVTTKTMTDTVTLTDAALDPTYRVRQMSDTVAVTDQTVLWRRFKRIAEDTATLVDSVVKTLILAGSTTYTKVMSDTLAVTDAVVQWLRRVRGPIDTVTLSDGDTYRASIITASEAIDVADGFVSWRRLKRLAQDNLDVIDGFSKTLAGAGIVYAKVMSDTVTLIDDAGQRWKLRVSQLTDAVGLSDQVIRSIRAVRSLGDVVEFSDGTVKVRRSVRSMDETLEVSDAQISTLYLDQVSNTSFSFGSSGPPFRFGGM